MPARANALYINGRFLTQSMTGVQRYAREVVRAMDDLLEERRSDFPGGVYVVAPNKVREAASWRNIELVPCGALSGHAWDQIDLLAAARHGVLLSMCSAGPVLHPRHLVVIHDAMVFRDPDTFSMAYRTVHQNLGRALARVAQLATVSHFSAGELNAVLKPSRPIIVAPNSADHCRAITASRAFVQENALSGSRFFLGLGSVKKNKNFSVAIGAMRMLGQVEAKLVIVGDRNNKVFEFDGVGDDPNVIWAGRCSDETVAGLMQEATAFVFPSTYEGFGLPPLEAMVHGCPVIASTAPAVLEVCDGAARFFHPSSKEELAARMHEALGDGPGDRAAWIAKGAKRAKAYTWRATATTLLDAAAEVASG